MDDIDELLLGKKKLSEKKMNDIDELLFGKKKPFDLWGKTSTAKKRSSCPKAVRESVWRKYFGNRMTGRCYVCKKPINFTDFEVGHNKPFSKGGTWNLNNLRPICRTCNRSMGTMSLETFKKKYFAKKPVRRKKARSETRAEGVYWINLTGKKRKKDILDFDF